MDALALARAFAEACEAVMGEALTGVYLHGSLAMGCFHPETSDIDLIAVVERGMTEEEKLRLMEEIVRLNQLAPQKGLEISFVRRIFLKPFVYPTPFELHFSPAHLKRYAEDPRGYVARMKGTDKDLAAHFTIINAYGKTLLGRQIREVFGKVPRADYIDSIVCDVENAPEDILENPVYIVLNLSRVLACLREGKILSKEKGGAWGMEKLADEYRPLIKGALAAYRAEGQMETDEALQKKFAESCLKEIMGHARRTE